MQDIKNARQQNGRHNNALVKNARHENAGNTEYGKPRLYKQVMNIRVL